MRSIGMKRKTIDVSDETKVRVSFEGFTDINDAKQFLNELQAFVLKYSGQQQLAEAAQRLGEKS